MGFPTGGTGTSAPLPTGAATAARQDTGNASLALIDSKLTPPVAVEIEGHLGNGVVNELIRATPTAELGIDWDED